MPSKRDSPSDDSDIDHVSPPRTFSKKFKTTPTTAEQHAAQSEKTTPTKSPKREGWSAEKRLRLFLAYESLAQIKWDEVAAKVSLDTLYFNPRRPLIGGDVALMAGGGRGHGQVLQTAMATGNGQQDPKSAL